MELRPNKKSRWGASLFFVLTSFAFVLFISALCYLHITRACVYNFIALVKANWDGSTNALQRRVSALQSTDDAFFFFLILALCSSTKAYRWTKGRNEAIGDDRVSRNGGTRRWILDFVEHRSIGINCLHSVMKVVASFENIVQVV